MDSRWQPGPGLQLIEGSNPQPGRRTLDASTPKVLRLGHAGGFLTQALRRLAGPAASSSIPSTILRRGEDSKVHSFSACDLRLRPSFVAGGFEGSFLLRSRPPPLSWFLHLLSTTRDALTLGLPRTSALFRTKVLRAEEILRSD